MHKDGLTMQWSFTCKRWEAVFIAGHAQGQVVQFGAEDVTPALHGKLRKLKLVSSWYSKTNASTNKLAAKEYIMLLCQAIDKKRLHEHNAEFEQLLAVAPATVGNDSDGAEGGAVLFEDELHGEEEPVPGEDNSEQQL